MPGVTLLDGSRGVANEAKRQLEKNGLLVELDRPGEVIILNSNDSNI